MSADVSKLVQYAAIGAPEDRASVSKLVMYVVYQPGTPTGTPAPKQAHVYSQVVRNR